MRFAFELATDVLQIRFETGWLYKKTQDNF